MGAMASQITSLTIAYSDADQRKHQSSASLAFVWGIHRGPVNSPHKCSVTRKMFPFDDVIMDMIWEVNNDFQWCADNNKKKFDTQCEPAILFIDHNNTWVVKWSTRYKRVPCHSMLLQFHQSMSYSSMHEITSHRQLCDEITYAFSIFRSILVYLARVNDVTTRGCGNYIR